MKQTAVEWLDEQLQIMDSKSYNNLIQIEMGRNNYKEIIEQAKEMEKEQKHKSIDKQVSILKGTLEEMMTGFDSEEDRIDFILDICNGYKKRINL
jgi:hydroxylamine reductase (hybrid-cluster protein)